MHGIGMKTWFTQLFAKPPFVMLMSILLCVMFYCAVERVHPLSRFKWLLQPTLFYYVQPAMRRRRNCPCRMSEDKTIHVR